MLKLDCNELTSIQGGAINVPNAGRSYKRLVAWVYKFFNSYF